MWSIRSVNKDNSKKANTRYESSWIDIQRRPGRYSQTWVVFLYKITTLLVHTAWPPLSAAATWYGPWEAAQSLLLRPTLLNIGHDQRTYTASVDRGYSAPADSWMTFTCVGWKRVPTCRQVQFLHAVITVGVQLHHSPDSRFNWAAVSLLLRGHIKLRDFLRCGNLPACGLHMRSGLGLVYA